MESESGGSGKTSIPDSSVRPIPNEGFLCPVVDETLPDEKCRWKKVKGANTRVRAREKASRTKLKELEIIPKSPNVPRIYPNEDSLSEEGPLLEDRFYWEVVGKAKGGL